MLTEILHAALVLLSIAYLCSWCLKIRRFIVLGNKIPGPPALPIIGNLIDTLKLNCDAMALLDMLHEYHGERGIVRLWTGLELLVSISDPRDCETFFTHKSLTNRSAQYRPMEEWFGKGNIITSNGEEWRKARRIMVQSFHTIPQGILLKKLLDDSGHLLATLGENSPSCYKELVPILRRHAERVTTRITLNEEWQADSDIAKALLFSDELLQISALRLISPLHYTDIGFYFTREGRLMKKLARKLKKTMENIIIKARRQLYHMHSENIEPPNSYVFNLIQKFPSESTATLATHLLLIFLTAGDTTSGSMGFTLTMIAMHPEVQEKVFEEDAEIQKNLGSRPMEPSDLQSYNYLEKVIKESLRLFPVAPMIGRTAGEDVQFGKFTVPKGTNVCAMPFWTNRSESVFENPLKFDPERFREDRVEKLHPYAFQPFSTGLKSCAGHTFAMMSMKIIISTTIRNYRLTSEYKNIAAVDKNLVWTFTLKDKNGCNLKLEKR